MEIKLSFFCNLTINIYNKNMENKKRLDLEHNKIFIERKEKGRYLAFSLLQDRVKIYKDT